MTEGPNGRADWPYAPDRRRPTLAGMPSRRYRMSGTGRADALQRELDLDDTFRASRPLGCAYVRVVDIEHPTDLCPDWLVHAVDPLARLERAYADTPDATA
jgi:hypothetical protein